MVKSVSGRRTLIDLWQFMAAEGVRQMIYGNFRLFYWECDLERLCKNSNNLVIDNQGEIVLF